MYLKISLSYSFIFENTRADEKSAPLLQRDIHKTKLNTLFTDGSLKIPHAVNTGA